ncbi:MAG: hypothetical protein PHH37_10395 [Paludibacter sp.]|nr:hypothetical protein [Paludibacter sp.]
MKKNQITILSVFIVVIVALIIAVIYFVNKANQKEKDLQAVAEMMTFEKEQVEHEYQDLATEFDGYTSGTIRNDSLFKLLEDQKVKVQQLLEELRITKATNARRIVELKKELATVRSVMIHYVNQIDSLNAENKVLRTENVEVKRKYREATQTVEQLSKEKENLNEVVTRAAKLEVTNFNMVKLNKHNRKTTWFSQVATLEFDYTVSKNITAEPGAKTVYLRLTRPDGEVLTKSDSNVFPFENKKIAYSAKKDIDYKGEELKDIIYWKVEEIIQKGDYRADFFIDGNLVGSFTFVVKS